MVGAAFALVLASGLTAFAASPAFASALEARAEDHVRAVIARHAAPAHRTARDVRCSESSWSGRLLKGEADLVCEFDSPCGRSRLFLARDGRGFRPPNTSDAKALRGACATLVDG